LNDNELNQIPFIPGLELAASFYHDAVRPILDLYFPGVSHAAARLDYGSDVLGFDTPQSRDHGWGPKVTLYLSKTDLDQYKDQISTAMAEYLPLEILDYPTNYDAPFTGEAGMVAIESGPVSHWVALTTDSDFFKGYLGVDPIEPLDVVDWLTIPAQHLRTIASGEIFQDDPGLLTDVVERLRWYPHEIWLYMLANQWRRIDQEEPFMARCGDVGDEAGSRLVATRQVDELMRLCFLMERQYMPYYKWLGTAFNRLDCSVELNPIFQSVFNSQTWRERETHLSEAYLVVMKMHNALGLTPFIEPEITPFFNRPYLVPHAGRFSDALHEAIQSEFLRDLPRDLGALSQFVNSTDILSNPEVCRKLKLVYK
jgi:hypothetical protein